LESISWDGDEAGACVDDANGVRRRCFSWQGLVGGLGFVEPRGVGHYRLASVLSPCQINRPKPIINYLELSQIIAHNLRLIRGANGDITRLLGGHIGSAILMA